jgi:hypothetical protein
VPATPQQCAGVTAGDSIAGFLSYNGNNDQRLAERAVPEIELDRHGMPSGSVFETAYPAAYDFEARRVGRQLLHSDPGNDRRSDRAR